MAIASVIYLLSLFVFYLSFINKDDEENIEQHHWMITDCREFIDLDEEANV